MEKQKLTRTPLDTLRGLLLKETNKSIMEILKELWYIGYNEKPFLTPLKQRVKQLFTSIAFKHCKEFLASFCPPQNDTQE